MSAKLISRRDALKASAALGGLALSGGVLIPREAGADLACQGSCYPPTDEAERQRYSYFQEHLEPLEYYTTDATGFQSARYPPLDPDEMRITFMGSMIPPVRRAQQMMSIFVEVGWDNEHYRARDSFVLDCGSGVCANYGAMDVGYARMDKVFISHLHGDHMSDLTHIYCFGPSADRVTPQFVFGPGPSGIKSPRAPRRYYDDGTKAFCRNLREAMRWHTESFGFQHTSYKRYPSPEIIRYQWGLPVVPGQVSDDPWGDGYAMVPIELDWRMEGGVAYDNIHTGVKITHFPVIHARQGSIGYRVEWNGLTMVYTSDTKPEKVSVRQAINGGDGVDVFIHEMGVPPDVWAMQAQHMKVPPPGESAAVERLKMVQNSSHTPQGPFGYLLSQIEPKPKLTVATHFPTADDTVYCAMNSLAQYVDPAWLGDIGEKVTFSFDRMVLRLHVGSDVIEQRRGEVLDFGASPIVRTNSDLLATPKYATADGEGDPYAQIDPTEAYEPGANTYCDTGY